MHSPKNWELQIDPNLFKAAKKIPRRDASKILRAVRLLPLNPYYGDIQKMKGEKTYGDGASVHIVSSTNFFPARELSWYFTSNEELPPPIRQMVALLSGAGISP